MSGARRRTVSPMSCEPSAADRPAWPDLQALVALRGGFHRITPADWEAFDAAIRRWRAWYRGQVGRGALEAPAPKGKNREKGYP